MRLPGFEPAPALVDHARKVIRMEGVEGDPMLKFLSHLAEIFQDLAVEIFDLPCRTQGKHKPRNVVDDQTKALLTLPKRCLAALALNRNRPRMPQLSHD